MNLDQINDLHEQAMTLAEAAVIARTEGDEAASCERFMEALDLAGEPPPEIAEEIRDLLEQIYARRELLVI
jgi:hypothetical protein